MRFLFDGQGGSLSEGAYVINQKKKARQSVTAGKKFHPTNQKENSINSINRRRLRGR